MSSLSKSPSQKSASSSSDGESSVGSDASGASGKSSAVGDGEDEDVQEMLRSRSAVEDIAFGIIREVQAQKYSGMQWYAIMSIFIEYAQLCYFIIAPEMDWDLDYHFSILRWWRRIQLSNAIIDKGYAFYLAFNYISVAVIILTAGLVGYMAWSMKNGATAKSQWKIFWIRLVANSFVGIFYLSVLTMFTTSFNCHFETKSHWTPMVASGSLKSFPDKKCLETPMVIHGAASLVSAVLLVVGGHLFTMSGAEGNVLTNDLLAMPNAGPACTMYYAKTAIAVVPVFLSWHLQLQAIVLVWATGALCHQVYHYAPFYNVWMNRTHLAGYAALLWGAVLLLVRAAFPDDVGMGDLTWVLGAGVVPIAALGYFAAVVRCHLPRRMATKFATDMSLAYAKDQFKSPVDVEIASRCVRIRSGGRDSEPMETFVDAAEALLTCGLQQFPDEPDLVLYFINFYVDVKKNFASGQERLEHARRMRPDLTQRYYIYTRAVDIKDMERLATEGGEAGDMNMINYAEFQTSYRQLMHAHRGALRSTRKFWKGLAHKNLALKTVLESIAKIDRCETKAVQMYRSMLEHYPQSVKLLRSYGRFVEDVLSDFKLSTHYFSMADKLEDELAEKHREAELDMLAGGGDGGAESNDVSNVAMHLDDYDYTDAILVIDRFGEIKVANGKLNKLFGYKKGELIGKNIRGMMPAPFSTNHDSYLRRFAMTGVPRILGSTRDMIAMHKDRHIFPCILGVFPVDLDESDHFMGIFKEKKEDRSVAVLYTTTQGTILCANEIFTDMFGFTTYDILGKPASSFTTSPSEVDSVLLQQAQYLLEEEVSDDYEPPTNRITIVHKVDVPIQVDMRIKPGGTATQRILVVELQQPRGLCGVVKFTMGGTVTEHNRAAQEVLGGYSKKEMKELTINDMMLDDYALFHQKWVQSADPTHSSPWSCQTGRPVRLLQKHGVDVDASIRVHIRNDASGQKEFVVFMHLLEAELVESARALALQITATGTIERITGGAEVLQSASHGPWAPEELVGQSISMLVGVKDERLRVPGRSDDLWLEQTLAHMVDQVRRGAISSWRGFLRPSEESEKTIPVTITVDQADGGVLLLKVYPFVAMEGFIEFSHDLNVAMVDGDTEMMTCLNAQELLGKSVSDVMPLVAPRQKSSELVGASISGGGTKSKKVIGPKRQVQLLHGDRTYMTVTAQTAVKRKKHKGKAADKSKTISTYLVRMVGHVSDNYDDSTVEPETMWGHAFLEEEEVEEEAVTISRGVEDAGSDGGEEEDASDDGSAAEPREDLDPDAMEDAALETREEMEDLSDDGKGGAGPPQKAAGLPIEPDSSAKGDITSLQKPKLDVVVPVRAGSASAPVDIETWAAQASAVPAAVGLEDPLDMEEGGPSAGGPKGLPPPPSDGDDASAVSGSDWAGLDEAIDVSRDENYQRIKRLKKIERVVAAAAMKSALSRLARYFRIALAVLTVVHVIGYVILRVVEGTYIEGLDEYASELGAMARVRVSVARNDNVNNSHSEATWNEANRYMRQAIDEFQKNHIGLFLGTGSLRKLTDPDKLSLYTDPEIPVRFWDDTQVPGVEYERNLGLWDLGNRFVSSARQVEHPAFDAANGAGNKAFRFLQLNGPQTLTQEFIALTDIQRSAVNSSLDGLLMIILIIVVIEAIAIVPLVSSLLVGLLKKVIRERDGLFSVFVVIPRPTLVALAAKEIELDDDQQDDDVDDDDEFAEEAERTGGRRADADDDEGGGSALKMKFDAKGRRFSPLRRDVYLLTIPIFAWGALILVTYILAYMDIRKSRHSIRDLGMASQLATQAQRARYYANELVLVDKDTPERLAHVEELRQRLRESTELCKAKYIFLLFGEKGEEKGNIFRSLTNTNHMFRIKNCLQTNEQRTGGECYAEGHPWHVLTQRGLNDIIYSFVDSALLLADEPLSGLNVNNPLFQYAWEVGGHDLLDAVATSKGKYMSEARDIIAKHQTIGMMIIVLCVVLGAVTYLALVVPFVKRSTRINLRVASLLSQLPRDADVISITEQALAGAYTGEPAVEDKQEGKMKAIGNKVGLSMFSDNTVGRKPKGL